MSLTRTYKYVNGIIEGRDFRLLEEISCDALEEEKNPQDVPIIKLTELIKKLKYHISDKKLWDIIDHAKTAEEFMFLMNPETQQIFNIRTQGKLRTTQNIVIDDEGYYFFLEMFICKRSKNELLEMFEPCKGMNITVEIHGKERKF